MNLNITTRRQEGKEGRREGEREKGSFRTPWKASDDESNAVDQTLARKGERKREREKQRDTTLTRQRSNSRWRCAAEAAGEGRSRLESEREGCFRAGRYSRKSRELAEWRENSCG